ncbi:uncharacterized protein LOC120345146 isoform X5 [Styela clava]
MSSEEKEPYFHGPSVTPSSGQGGLYHPDMAASTNPLGQIQPQSSIAPPPQPTPMFYNPNDYGGAASSPWNSMNVMPQSSQQQQYHMNGPSMGDNTMGLQGTQAYFGGVDSNSSASSSQHTSPAHVPHQKVNDMPLEAPQYEPQLYSTNANTLFPQASNISPPAQSYNPHYVASEGMNLSNTIPPPGGASGQHGYTHPTASGLFVPNSEMNNTPLQNYMNPAQHEPASVSPQLNQYSGNIPDVMDIQSHMPEQHDEQNEIKYESVSPINPMDLHNGTHATDYVNNPVTSDQSYMNMAYSNHDTNYSGGPVPSQMQPVNAYISGEFQVDAYQPSNMMIPASSSQDYDILHSQGTWNEHNQVTVLEHAQQDIRGAEGLEQREEARAEEAVTDDMQQPETFSYEEIISTDDKTNRDNLAEGHSQQVFDMNSQTEEHPLHQPSVSLYEPVGASVDSHISPQQMHNPGLHMETNSVQSHFSNLKLSEGDDTINNNENGSIRPMSHENHPDIVLSPETRQANLHLNEYSRGSPPPHSAADYQIESNQQSYESQNDQNIELSTPSTSHQQSEHQILTSVPSMGEPEPETADPPQVSESPIPADGLHPRQSDVVDPGPHHFASPTSAFESRIRSQSTGSNNSNASSQRSATSQANRTTQNRNIPSGSVANPPSSQESAARQSSVPTSNPFSTNTMHSSHLGSQLGAAVSASAAEPFIPPIPDIVRPLPSEQGSENLRTGATVPLSSNHSLHSQALGYRTMYLPDPPAVSGSTTQASSTRSQPDVIQSPPEREATRLQASAENTHTVMALKTSIPHSGNPPVSSAPSIPTVLQPTSVNSDPYLSRSLYNTHSDQNQSQPAAVNTNNQEHTNPPEVEQPSERVVPLPTSSSATHLPQATDDGPSRDQDNSLRQHPSESHRQDEDSWYRGQSDRDHYSDRGESRDPRDSRDPRWDDYHRRHPDDYERRDPREDSRYSRDRSWDPRDRDDRHSRYDEIPKANSERNSRPSSRQGDPAATNYSRRYDDRDYGREYDRYYSRDKYYDDRYHDYDRRDPYYQSYDRRNDRYYEQHHRYPDAYHRRGYEDYYYDSYYNDYRYHRRPEDEDTRSVYSERSRVNEPDPSADRNWESRQSYADQSHYDYNSSHGYDRRYYDDSIMDESTLSNTYDESWQRLPQVPSRQTPAKFSTAHTIFRFGPGGQLIKVLPNRPMENQPTTVEIHSLEIMLQGNPEAEDLRSYAGPLSKENTHKNDVLQFVSSRSLESMKDMDLLDRRSTSLIWDFLALLVRQNGSVLGTDIAELLTKDHSGSFDLLQSPLEASRQRQLQLQLHRTTTPNSISDDATAGSTASPVPDHVESSSIHSVEILSAAVKNCNRFRELLLHGRKKDALEWAMKMGLWGHALLLASKTDSRTHAQVMLRFANSLPINDPLQTVYQLMSGRQPAAATCVSEEGWGDWRPHLAMILSNPTSSASLDMRAVLTMGDTLSSRGLLHAAHFCYLMSSTPLGYYGRPTSKMVLLGANHTLSFLEFASLDSIRRTEIYEYAISLGKNQRSSDAATVLPTFQLYKFIYACKLAEYGLIAQALHYCERIAKSVCRSPTSYSFTLVNQLVNVSDQLRHHDPQIHAGMADGESPRWLETLRNINSQIQCKLIVPRTGNDKSGLIVPRIHGPSSLLTVSNTPSIVSTSPTSESPNDEIRFSAHTPEQDDDDVQDSGLPDSNPPVQNYGHHQQYNTGYQTQQVQMYSATENPSAVPTHDPHMPSNMMVPDGAMQQHSENYSQGHQSQFQPQDPQGYGMQSNYQQFMQPSGQPYAQPSVQQAQGFEHLANQANPLASAGFSAPTSQTMHQHQNNYGFNTEQQQQPDEEAERNDQVDYYDYMSNAHKVHHGGRAGSPRSRTVSQSSQRSRASTLKGYDRTTPTSMMNHTEKQGRRSRTTSENSTGRRSRKTSGEQTHQSKQKKKDDIKDDTVKKSGSWSLFSWLSRRASKQVHLPDDNNKDIVWDNDQQRWVDKNATEEDSAPLAPPPIDDNKSQAIHQGQNQQQLGQVPTTPAPQPLGPTPEDKEADFISKLNSSSAPPMTSSLKPTVNGEAQLTANRFSLKNLGGNRSMYKNAFSSSSTPAVAPAPPALLPGMQNTNQPKFTGFMVPNPVPTSQPTSEEPTPAAASTPMHGHNSNAETIPMFTPGNTPHESSTDFRQPFNHGGGGSNFVNEPQLSAASGNDNAASGPGPTMFFNPAQFSAPASHPSMPSGGGRGNALRRGRGRTGGYAGRR